MAETEKPGDPESRAHKSPDGLFGRQSGPTSPAIEQRHSGRFPKESVKSPPTIFSEWSHQNATQPLPEEDTCDVNDNALEDDGEWQDMPAIAEHDIYDDDSGHIIARAQPLTEERLAGKAKGYSRVQGDDDARSVDSVDEQTNHLFNAGGENSGLDDEATVASQLTHTKDLLTEGQRIAYIGICKLVIVSMLKEMTVFNSSKNSKGEGQYALEGMILWSQKITVRLYQHIEITPAEQLMMEQLSEHKIEARDLAPTLMTASRVSNPLKEQTDTDAPPAYSSNEASPQADNDKATFEKEVIESAETSATAPTETTKSDTLENEDKLELDVRWTVLFDLFLLLICDSHYDSRSRVFFIQVARTLGVTYLELTKFEKKVTDALEVQDQENSHVSLDEENTLTTTRDKSSRNRRYMLMGLATIGGGLVIGLSAGLLAPVIGAGLGAGFASIGVSGATSFLAGTTGAALITTSGVVTGSTIATRSAAKRVSSVKTFEFKPLYDNKRVNLLITIPGWLAGKEDDVRLPFSTVDPVMGDICSVLWEPELLRTFQATGNILATEVLTQSLQQVLGQTVLTALMSALQWPLVLTKLSYLIDNPWSNSLDRAKAAGLILADALVARSLGVRPISLVGYSLGARVIYFALLELARIQAFGIIENVYLFGAPVVVTARDWRKARSIVAGRFVNGYVQNDWILGYLFRATSGGIGRVAGLRPVEGIDSVENMDFTGDVQGHMGYRSSIPKLMQKVGYQITSDEFQEIEDPDPDKTREKARELLDDIEEARRSGSAQKKKKSFFSFGRSKNLVTPDALPTSHDVEPIAYDSHVRPVKKSLDASSHTTEEVSASVASDAEFDINKIRSEAHKRALSPPSTDTRSRPSTPAPNSSPLRAHSVDEISMTFDLPVQTPRASSAVSRPSTPHSFSALRVSSSQDGEPSGYVPRPSLHHANTTTGAFPRNSTSSFRSMASNTSRSAIDSVMGVPISPLTPAPMSLERSRSHQSTVEDDIEDFSQEGEITMSFG